jgi:hypothetical protein
MSRQENKILMLIFLELLFFTSCNKYQKFNEEEIDSIRNNSIKFSQSMIGENEYTYIYNNLNDSIKNWISNHIPYIEGYSIGREWVLDSIICINENGNRLITSVLKKSLYDGSNTDFIDYFYGAKIQNQWYFFMGPHLALPREFYQEDIHTPLSFELLKQIATSNIYRGYLRKGKKGKWEVNERFFDDIISKNQRIGGYGSCLDCMTEEEYVLYRVREKWASNTKSVRDE